MKPSYKIERWTHGWLLCGCGDSPRSIPMDALSECGKLFPKTAVMSLSIPHHFHATGRQDVVMCIATAADENKWRQAIVESLNGLPPQERWWKGVDCGMSSVAIFAVFCEDRFRFEAQEYAKGSVPRDAGDFGRCVRLLALFPEWRKKLDQVAAAYPETKWPALVAQWDKLDAATDSEVYDALNKLQ